MDYGIYKYNEGQIDISEHEGRSSVHGFGSITLCEQVITLGIPPQGTKKLKGKVLELLEEERRKVMAENHARLKTVQDKIDSLLAIDHKKG